MGEDNMLAVVCKSYAVAGSLERYDEESGRIDRERHLHAIANEFGKSIKARFSFICVEHIFPGYKVLERLKNLGVEQIEEIYLPEEISTHSDAMSAFQRLQKPDALFGRDRSAQVAFSQSIHPSGAAVFREFQESQIQEFLSASSLKKLRNKLRSLEQKHKECSANLRAREVEWDLQMEELTGDLNQCRLELNYKDQQIEKLQMELEGYRSTIMQLNLENEEVSTMLLMIWIEQTQTYLRKPLK
ncbi:hypothetical protein Syun_001180 [Stephania yunnanensis]|uniref:Uncharacterized protein n=1 Tax=Stephania yunnanensis TaxID=152371 RepID=A0AAP0LE93_9MAGN